MHETLKILSFLPHHGKAMSGGERSFFEILKRWAEWGNHIHVVTTTEGVSLLKNQKFKFHPHVYEFPEKTGILAWYHSVLNAVKKIPENGFDFIYSNEPYTSLIPAFLAKNKTKAPLVLVFKLLETHESNFASCYRNYKRQLTTSGSIAETLGISARNVLSKRADLVLIVSEYYREILKEMGIEPQRIRAVAHGVDLKHVMSLAASGGKRFDACFMGGFIPRKGIFDLVSAWRKVVDVRPEARLAMIGTGEKAVVDKLNSKIASLGLRKNVFQTGWLNDEKYRVLKESELFVFPSYGEGFALAICEAMACGLPVIAYDLQAYRTIYKKGLVRVKVGDVRSLAESIVEVLGNEMFRAKLAKDAIEQAREYDWDNSARNQLDIITKFLEIKE